MDLVRTPRRLRRSIENGFRAVGGGGAVRMMDGVGSVALTGWSQMRVLDGQAKAMRGLNNDLHSFQARAHLRRACKETTRRSRRRSRRDPACTRPALGGAGDPACSRPSHAQLPIHTRSLGTCRPLHLLSSSQVPPNTSCATTRRVSLSSLNSHTHNLKICTCRKSSERCKPTSLLHCKTSSTTSSSWSPGAGSL
jgi:hypothetical protein